MDIKYRNNYNAWDEKRVFLDIIHHDARGGKIIKMVKDNKNSVIHTSTTNDNFNKITDYAKTYADEYVSVNSFRTPRRKNSSVYCHENIAIDIDLHNTKDIESELSKIKDRLKYAYQNRLLPVPTVVNSTGRGLCAIYTLERSIPRGKGTKKAVDKLDIVRNHLFDKYDEILAGYNCEIDRSVSDAARVIRLPGTINQKNGEFCRLEGVFENSDKTIHYVSLESLATELGCNKHKSDYAKKISKKSNAKKKVIGVYGLPCRLKKINKLIELRGGDCAGCREQLLFVAYSSAKQIMPDFDAQNYVFDLNDKFTHPLPKSEIYNIFKTTSRVTNVLGETGYYVISDAYIIAKLGITEDENKILQFASLSKTAQREEIKARNKDKKDARNNTIITLFNDGYLYEEIARKVECSLSTVKRVLKANKLTRYGKSVFFLEDSISKFLRKMNVKTKVSKNARVSVVGKKQETHCGQSVTNSLVADTKSIVTTCWSVLSRPHALDSSNRLHLSNSLCSLFSMTPFNPSNSLLAHRLDVSFVPS